MFSLSKAAENLLLKLGALEVNKTKTKSVKEAQITKITGLGKTMACFPVNPRYSKMLTLANQHSLLEYVICMISALSVQELFVDGEYVFDQKTSENKETSVRIKFSQLRQAWAGHGATLSLGDIMVLLVAIGSVEYESDNETKFCEQNGIRFKGISEARKLRKQLTNIGESCVDGRGQKKSKLIFFPLSVNSIFPSIDMIMNPKLQPPTDKQAKLLRQIFLSGMVDKIAK
jgi:ATP-dependent RNA helicase DHX37/DHR1